MLTNSTFFFSNLEIFFISSGQKEKKKKKGNEKETVVRSEVHFDGSTEPVVPETYHSHNGNKIMN